MEELHLLRHEVALLTRKLAREQAGRQHAEQLLESKARELYELNQQLSEALHSLKQHEIQLVQQEKLASIGQLAAGVAHEINTPAGYAMCNLEMLQQYLQDLVAYQNALAEQSNCDKEQLTALQEQFHVYSITQDLPELLTETQEGMQRIATIVRELRSFARQGGDDKQWMVLDELLEEALHLTASQIKYHVQLVTNFNCKQPFFCAPSKLSQVFVNLIVNAGQAMKGEGVLTIESEEDEHSVTLRFIDTGVGIAAENLLKIFDPFFTTKPIGQGTGLGLSISQDIVRQHNGQMSVSSKLGVGTVFTICLPKHEADKAEGE
ncbi:sensor histidine kinase [Pseudoalteromonas fenneropenaei]|uniref:histidine kinase n=1 Tax=Pseudoalteromonas fenneropenaei TaxID=1737459 RepID=A0ABV7CGK9_9GAMM